MQKKNPHFSFTQTPTAIIWRINLPPKEIEQNPDHVADEKKEQEDNNYIQIINTKKMTGQKMLAQIIKHVECKVQMPFSSQKVLQRRYQTTRKLCEWILKYNKKNVEDIADFIEEDKEMIKLWLQKKLQSSQEKQRLMEKIKEWVVYNCKNLPEKVILKIGTKYLAHKNKTQQKLKLKQNGVQIQHQYIQQSKYPGAIMIHNTAPGRKNYKKKQIVEFDTSALQKIEINFKIKNGTRLQERIFWDNSDGDSLDKMYRFAYHFIIDYLREKKMLNIVSDSDVSNYCLKIVKQITAQQNKNSDILLCRQVLNQFDSNRINADPELQEELIKVKIILRDENRKVFYSDQFEWDMYSDFMDVEKFAMILCNDMNFDLVYATEIQTQMRRQIINYLNKQLQKLADFFPHFSENYDSETFSRFREKAFMKKKILNLFNDHLLQLPKDYDILDRTEISQSDVMTLVQNNLDMMPQQYLNQILRHGNSTACFPSQAAVLDPHKFKITNEDCSKFIQESNSVLQENKYIPEELKQQFTEQELLEVVNKQINSKFIVSFKNEDQHSN